MQITSVMRKILEKIQYAGTYRDRQNGKASYSYKYNYLGKKA
jgi:hypothetical protein